MNNMFPTFEDFWNIWPRKDAKMPAQKAFSKLKLDWNDLSAIQSDIERRLRIGEWVASKEKRKFIPHPASYLNAERWTDDQEEPVLLVTTTTDTRSRSLQDDLTDKSWV